jgi:hypothetical protein
LGHRGSIAGEMMNDDEMIEQLAPAIEPFKAMVSRLLAVVERLIARMELLELEMLHGRPAPPSTPIAPPDSTDPNDPTVP